MSRRAWIAGSAVLGAALGLGLGAFAESDRSLAARLGGHPGTRAAVAELAEAGVVDAMLMLCRHYGAGSGTEGRSWCARAVESGSPVALRDVGHALVQEPEDAARAEGLTLLAMAELAHDAEAAASLAVLPDFVAVRPAEVEAARQLAVERIDAARWIDTERLGVSLELGPEEERRGEQGKARLRQRAATLSRADPAERARQLAARRGAERAGLGVSEGERAAYARRLAQDDRRQDLINRREEAKLERLARASGEERARLERAADRRRGAELRAQVVAPPLRRRMSQRLALLLERINAHRASDQALRVEDLELPWSNRPEAP